MFCDLEMHEGFKDFGESCPFCGKFEVGEDERCCDDQNIINDSGYLVCKKCGQVAGYKIVNEYVDFRENFYRFRRKSVYNRKYHIENVINNLSAASLIFVNCQQRERIHYIFAEINKIISNIDGKRKRIVSIKYLLERILDKMGLEHGLLICIKSGRTLDCYKEYWKGIEEKLGDIFKPPKT